MIIYKLLQQCLSKNQSIKLNVFNKYQTYFFHVFFFQEKYYLFLNDKPIDLKHFISYILTLEICIATDSNLYSDCAINYEVEKGILKDKVTPINDKYYDQKCLGIKPTLVISSLKKSYQSIGSINNILKLQNISSISALEANIYSLLDTAPKTFSGVKINSNFFRLLALKLTENFYQNRSNLLELFGNAILNNQDLIVYFKLKGIFYEAKFSFTDVNNLEVRLENFNMTYIGSKGFAVLYIISVLYNEDYEKAFVVKQIPSKLTRSNRQSLLDAYLLNELINQNKENSDKLLEIVHNYYHQKGLMQTNLLFLIRDIEKVINGDSEFQDYSQDKSIVYDWLKENADTLLGTYSLGNANIKNYKELVKKINKENANYNKSFELTLKPKLIYWPTDQK